MIISRIPEKGKATTPQSMNASFNGSAMLIERLRSLSIVGAVTETQASLGGTLKLQCSNNAFLDNTGNEVNSSATWVDVDSITYTVSGSGNFVWSVPHALWEAVRIVWTRSSGQGSLSAYFIAKEY